MTEIHIHLHPDGERAALGQIDQLLHHTDIAEAALVARIDAAGVDDRAIEDTFPANSRPRKAGARTIAGCPTLISPKSRSSSSARTRNAEISPIDSSGWTAEGVANSPGLALTCNTVPAIGARMVNFSMPACASASSARATLS
jgi:hypothetical protein